MLRRRPPTPSLLPPPLVVLPPAAAAAALHAALLCAGQWAAWCSLPQYQAPRPAALLATLERRAAHLVRRAAPGHRAQRATCIISARARQRHRVCAARNARVSTTAFCVLASPSVTAPAAAAPPLAASMYSACRPDEAFAVGEIRLQRRVRRLRQKHPAEVRPIVLGVGPDVRHGHGQLVRENPPGRARPGTQPDWYLTSPAMMTGVGGAAPCRHLSFFSEMFGLRSASRCSSRKARSCSKMCWLRFSRHLLGRQASGRRPSRGARSASAGSSTATTSGGGAGGTLLRRGPRRLQFSKEPPHNLLPDARRCWRRSAA